MRRAGWLVWVAACAVDLPLDDDPSPPIDGAIYRLDWSTEGVTAEDVGWSVETDLGYRVHVEEGWLVNYSLSLVSCETASVARLLSEIAVGTAYAGHGEELDPSAVLGLVEDLSQPDALQRDLAFEATSYCRIHYVVGHAHEGDALPDAPDLVGLSLYLHGTVTTPDGQTLPLSIASDVANAQLLDLEAADLTVSSDDARLAMVVVRRDLAGLFDGIDFESEPADADWQVVSNLMDHVAFDVTLAAR